MKIAIIGCIRLIVINNDYLLIICTKVAIFGLESSYISHIFGENILINVVLLFLWLFQL